MCWHDEGAELLGQVTTNRKPKIKKVAEGWVFEEGLLKRTSEPVPGTKEDLSVDAFPQTLEWIISCDYLH